MTRRRRERGWTLVEMIVVLALFGAFLIIIAILSLEMNRLEKRYPVNFMVHPETSAVVSRLRRDVYDSTSYRDTFPPGVNTWVQSHEVLILECVREDGTSETVIYDFRKEDEVHRLTFSAPAIAAQTGDWVAHAVPKFRFDAYDFASGRVATRFTATDSNGKVAIDEIFTPRPHG